MADRIGVAWKQQKIACDEMVAAGAGLAVFTCFVGDSDRRGGSRRGPIPQLETDPWVSPI